MAQEGLLRQNSPSSIITNKRKPLDLFIYIPNISQYLYIVTILDLYNQLEPLASQLLQQVIFLLALLDQTLPSLYLQLFNVYR